MLNAGVAVTDPQHNGPGQEVSFMPGVRTDVALRTPLAVPMTRRDPRRFFVGMAYACALIAIVGFTPTYWAPVAAGSFTGPPLLHLHGLLFTGWCLLFIVQARLVATGRLQRHRALGLAGIALATAMVGVGILVALQSLENRIAAGYDAEGRAFSIVPLSIILGFGALVAAAVINVRRPQVHMRLMLTATISILPAAIARLLFLMRSTDGVVRPALREPPTVTFALLSSAVSDLLLVVAILYDWRTRGKPHPAYLIAGAALLTVQILRIPLSSTSLWHRATAWLLTFAG
jgi:hypothetical protein